MGARVLGCKGLHPATAGRKNREGEKRRRRKEKERGKKKREKEKGRERERREGKEKGQGERRNRRKKTIKGAQTVFFFSFGEMKKNRPEKFSRPSGAILAKFR